MSKSNNQYRHFALKFEMKIENNDDDATGVVVATDTVEKEKPFTLLIT